MGDAQHGGDNSGGARRQSKSSGVAMREPGKVHAHPDMDARRACRTSPVLTVQASRKPDHWIDLRLRCRRDAFQHVARVAPWPNAGVLADDSLWKSIGFVLACWLSAAILLLGDSVGTIALSGVVVLAGLDLMIP